ncbi:MAG: hypothetical protein M1816_003685 [Peltula sp. TS41687]|nr:MAG: hypothetical protein M1816_003685 [Peltula sp. TS41687]
MFRQFQLPTLALLGLGSVTCAQNTLASRSSGASSPSSTSSSAAVTHTVTVGKANNAFVPAVVQANAGDYIEYQFFPLNHSVARAEYQFPCVPYEVTGRGKVGFFSGFRPVDVILVEDPPSWSIRINDTNPIFYYCTAPGSCIDYGMVGVINPNASVSLAIQQELAKRSAYMLQPGEPFPAEASSSIASLAPAATSTTAQAGSNSNSSSSHHRLSTGAIVGIAIGGAVALVLASALCFYIGRTKKLKQQINRDSTLTYGSAPPGTFGHGHTTGPFGPTPGIFEQPGGTPGTTYTGSTAYVPVKQTDMRYSHRSQQSDNIPPYTAELSEADMYDPPPIHSTSPRSLFHEFGGVAYSPHQSPPLDRYVFSAAPPGELDGYAVADLMDA